MQQLIGSELKQASIGQCLIKAMRPNSVIPLLLFGLRVEVDHAVGSKTLLIELSKLGHAISYDEVKRYKQSVVIDKDANNIDELTNGFTQWVAGNVDHTLATLDGKGTFHGMGIIACSLPQRPIPDKRVKRAATILKSGEVTKGHC